MLSLSDYTRVIVGVFEQQTDQTATCLRKLVMDQNEANWDAEVAYTVDASPSRQGWFIVNCQVIQRVSMTDCPTIEHLNAVERLVTP